MELWWKAKTGRDLFRDEIEQVHAWREGCDYFHDTVIVGYLDLLCSEREEAGKPLPKSPKWFTEKVRRLNTDRAEL